MTIKEIEVRTGLPRASVRFYEAEGLISPGRGSNNSRDYSREDCQTLLKIKLLRQLGCPLEDIRTVQAGACPLETALDRLLDYALCRLVWALVLTLGFRVNILRLGRQQFLLPAAALALMLCVEPVLLHFFGATPGKALLGLKLSRSDGSYFSLREGLGRTAAVIAMGLGLGIPVVLPVTGLMGLYRCGKNTEQPWALEDEVWSAPDRASAPRTAGYMAALGVTALLTGLGLLYAAAPPHRGALTPAELAENYNHLAGFSSRGEAEPLLTPEGQWEGQAGGSYPMELDPLELRVQEGRITGLTLSAHTGPETWAANLPVRQVKRTVCALLGRREIGPGGLSRQLNELDYIVPGSRSWTAEGWTLTLELTADSGFRVSAGTVFHDGSPLELTCRLHMEGPESS